MALTDSLVSVAQNGVSYLSGILAELRKQNTFDLTRQNLTQNISFTLANGETRVVYNSFRSMTILSITGATTGVFMQFGQSTGQPVNEIYAGLVFKTPRPDIFVDNFTLTNTSGATVTVQLMLGFMDVDDNRLNVSGNVSVVSASGTAINTRSGVGFNAAVNVAVGTSSTTLANLSTARSRLWVASLSSNTADAFITGSGAATTANGFPISPGQTFVFDNAGALNVIAASGTVNLRTISEIIP